ncbi:TPA: hypothetical protein EYN98_15570 [Candidatus Poribacteria bacterium]|nr:hypothetical protein [Candidatus Poribacteria bacterium]
MIGHLRPVKDPFRVANAVRLLPASSQIKVLHAGAALSPDMESEAVAETEPTLLLARRITTLENVAAIG